MQFLSKITRWISDLNAARQLGLTNDAGVLPFFLAEYKNDPIGAYEHYISTGTLPGR